MAWTDKTVALENDQVLLRPIDAKDRTELRSIALDERIWKYFVVNAGTESGFDGFFDAQLRNHANRTAIVFTIVDKSSGRLAGGMSFGNLAEAEDRIEIGSSWLGREFQGQGINRWAKYLLLEHAFETLSAQRVEFKTDVLNEQARAGLRKIGATEEGVLRSFNYMPGNRRRDAIYYSILADEWPHVKSQLLGTAAVTREEAQR